MTCTVLILALTSISPASHCGDTAAAMERRVAEASMPVMHSAVNGRPVPARFQVLGPVTTTVMHKIESDPGNGIETTPVPEPAAAGVLMLAGGALTLCRPKRDLCKGGFATSN